MWIATRPLAVRDDDGAVAVRDGDGAHAGRFT